MLEAVKDASIKDRISVTGGVNTFIWYWSREVTCRTNSELSSLCSMLSGFSFSNNTGGDSWEWLLASSGVLTVKKLSSIIDEQVLGEFTSNQETLLNNLVPKKIDIFAWRAFKKRLPVKIELGKRGIDLNDVLCPICNDVVESVDHSLILCKHVFDIWERVYKWWNLGNFSSTTIADISNNTGPNHASHSCFGKKLWQAVCWNCFYLIWKNRNKMVFQGKSWNTHLTLNEIQAKTFEWITSRSIGRKFDWLVWISNPSLYLSMS
ncbi:uncharacterized protein [Rutidosis leptorrhynchoides]|uniref:uncharacterized protein n=1 Tax=Rutidosis leptorrhynchoides TaxID=125765 RepID=UPI003A98EF0B